MTSDLLAVIEYFEREKGIDRETMVEAIEGALLTASRKSVGPARELRVDIDSAKGKIKALATLVVAEKVTKPYEEIALPVARRIKEDAEIGDEIDVEVTPKDFGRIAAQTARQAIMQRLRQAEKEMIYEEFKDRAGDIVQGEVRRLDRGDVVVSLGKFEGVMTSREKVPTETYNIGDILRFYVVAVENTQRGPEIVLSRSHPNFVRRLFEFEVSELADRTVEIRGVAREAGYRTKIAVFSADEKIDPVGACVGLRGARVKNIVRELNNEKVDIIHWSDNLREFVKESLKPAQIQDDKVTILEDERKIEVRVDEEELPKAVGRRGQNARLTSRLLGWDVQVLKDESQHEEFERKVLEAAQAIADELGIKLEWAVELVRGGLNSIGVIATADAEDITMMTSLGEEEAQSILETLAAKAANDAASDE
ncbi:transcription termination factor NusA [Sulfuriroseicoccus oceanibius]|uniref:Transcription termination/antitermination protein NusA n=1 Tax=Sulfuriroseicoccus oceanibius TaxID=2707525 RepID=A0A6B3L7W2_9BACT|nr:transcription termination factor NusA [Sulfuriroseicoccus oceanibius]QQL44177.1 transcription termination/antitermination protein NusA [Sulfuriroseicoccus oceanibius]